MAILELDKITKSFSGGLLGKKRRVLTDLSLEITQGEVFGLLGHNGAGKTTTMRVILGLLKPDAGQVTLFGQQGATRGQGSNLIEVAVPFDRLDMVVRVHEQKIRIGSRFRLQKRETPLQRVTYRLYSPWLGRGVASVDFAESRAVHDLHRTVCLV